MDESPEVRRHRLRRRQSVRRSVVRLAESVETTGLETRIAAEAMRRLGAALRAGERRMVIDEILDHPDLASLEAYSFHWYGDAPQA